LESVLSALQIFSSSLSYTWNVTRRQEEDILPRFEAIAGALNAIQPALDAAKGAGPDWWEHEAVPVLRDVVSWLAAVAADWGWEPYLTSSSRETVKTQRRERFRNEFERPLDEAAIVWFGEDRANCPRDVWNRARRGRQAGYTPEMALVEARSRLAPDSHWRRREAETACYGRTYPKLQEGREKRLWRLFHELRAALGRMPREAGRGERDAPSDALADSAAHRTATQNPPSDADRASAAPTKPKRSTERGEGRAKLISALTNHHKYADGGCLNLEPIGNNELARAADVSVSTASAFFHKEFRGHGKYKALCRNPGSLVAAFKLLNGEYSPHDLFGRRPADEGNHDEE
jgi:hypothetical protein